MSDWSDVPDALLRQANTAPLVSWLRNRGRQMSLLELDRERRHRGIRPPLRKKRNA